MNQSSIFSTNLKRVVCAGITIIKGKREWTGEGGANAFDEIIGINQKSIVSDGVVSVIQTLE